LVICHLSFVIGHLIQSLVMRGCDENLMRFVRRVHRRLVLVRAGERSGACVGVASIFACAFASVALIQRRDAMQLVLPMLAIGAIAGIIWGLIRRPTRFDAIIEADRQLNLSDLLATAYAQRNTDDPWQRAVVAVADARCRSLSPSDVIVYRYGGRAWGGIGLAAAMGLTLALLSGVPQDSRARAVASKSSPAAGQANADPADSATPSAIASPPRAQDDANASSRIGSRAAVASDADAADPTQRSTSHNTLRSPGADYTRAGAGDKPGQSTAASGDALPRPANATDHDAPANASAAPAGGGAASDASHVADSRDQSGGGKTSAADRASKEKSPPWSSPSWDADRAVAGDAMRAGRVPDAYRDVVSEYFRTRDRDGQRSR
jgi:hypothetical protein